MQIAVFVDAGYVYAQGTVLLTGQKQPRPRITLNVPIVIEQLTKLSEECCRAGRLLRIYWYDGILRSGRLSSEQEELANSRCCKLRLGVVNSRGEQKGVDSLLVTDLIDLARNRAITDALVLSGDEDIRIGVEIAQTFGVQVHLIGIKPARGSQSPDLIQEADTHTEWDETTISHFLAITPEEPDDGCAPVVASASNFVSTSLDEAIETALNDTIDELDQEKLQGVLRAFKANPASVPPEIDRRALGRVGHFLGRQLEDDERRAFRARCKKFLGEL